MQILLIITYCIGALIMFVYAAFIMVMSSIVSNTSVFYILLLSIIAGLFWPLILIVIGLDKLFNK